MSAASKSYVASAVPQESECTRAPLRQMHMPTLLPLQNLFIFMECAQRHADMADSELSRILPDSSMRPLKEVRPRWRVPLVIVGEVVREEVIGHAQRAGVATA